MSVVPTTGAGISLSTSLRPACAHGACAFTALVAAIACVDAGELPGPPYSVYVATQTDVDRETGGGRFDVVPRELAHVDDFDDLEGPWYRLLRGGELRARIVSGSAVLDGRFRDGRPAALRYVVRDGVAIARDYPSLMLASAAYQFEQVFGLLEPSTGYTPQQFVDRLGRLDVFFEPVIEVSGDVSGSVTLKYNAFFNPDGAQFGLARRSSAELVPLAADLKVISHEMGHAVQFLSFDNGLVEDCDPERGIDNSADPWFSGRLDYEYALRGLHEGFADWYSFAITGSPNSLGNQDFDVRDRSLVRDDFTWGELSWGDTLGVSVCDSEFYCIGTLFARSLLEAFQLLGNQPTVATDRHAFTTGVVRALQGAKGILRERHLLPPPQGGVVSCEVDLNLPSAYNGAIVGGYLEALVAGLPEAWRPALCDAFARRFGSEAFALEHREECGL